MTVTAIPKTTDPAEAAEPRDKRSRKKLVMILVVVLVVGAGGYSFLRPKPAGAPKPGEVVKLEPIQVNLADSHYLRIGVALQLVKGAAKADGSKALDATIEEFSGLDMAEVNDPAKRAVFKKELEKQLGQRYDGDVMGVYFTEFVTQ
ncbi:MAG: flagellar basal body-associated FliL family protein [Propionibacteriales bacterium]|jgi:flagellar FliL protein|nr:flagellar basal body-associated FliL family protein [Propionibacteriales bacterium]